MIVTEYYLANNFTPKSGVTPGSDNVVGMDCDQILSRYNVSISGVTTTGVRLPEQSQLSSSITTPIFIAASSGNATTSSIDIGATILSDGGSPVTSRGWYWSTDSTFETILGTITDSGSGIGQYEYTLTGLESNTTYYFLPWATNSVGTTEARSLIGSGCSTL